MLNNKMIEGKIPPHAIELEVAVLGAIMIESNTFPRIMNTLTPFCFYKEENQKVFEAIRDLFYAKRPIDLLTVTEQLKSNGNLILVGGAHYVTSLTNRVAGASHLEYHAAILKQHALSRELIKITGSILQDCYNVNCDPFDLKDRLSKDLLRIQRDLQHGNTKDWATSVEETYQTMLSTFNNPKVLTGIDTGNATLNAITGGWQKTDLITIAARPGMGKTARALNFLKAAVKQGKKCRFYSLEMSITQLITRLIAEGSAIDLTNIRMGDYSDNKLEQIQRVKEWLKGLPIVVNDNGRTTIWDITTECRALKQLGELDFMILDYIQIVKGNDKIKKNQTYWIGDVTGELKAIAKECDIPVMALAQVRRNSGTSDKRPTLEELKDGGSIEQDSDLVMFLHRPSYYTHGDMSRENDEELKELSSEAYQEYCESIIAKHRNGKLATVIEYFDGRIQRFTEEFVDFKGTGLNPF